MKKKILFALLLTTMTFNVACGKNNKEESTTVEQTSNETTSSESSTISQEATEENSSTELLQFSEIEQGEEVAILKTNYGDIKLRFFKEQAPKAVENFITHAKEGYYDGLTFHRVINDFMIQGGDPNGDGTGGESIWGEPFEDEIDIQNLRHFNGALSMANSGANTNGSQFFIVQNNKLDSSVKEYLEYFLENQDAEENGVKVKDVYPAEICEKYLEVGGTPWLDGQHTVFGQVYEGMDIVNEIASVSVSVDGNSKPLEDVIIESITIEEYK